MYEVTEHITKALAAKKINYEVSEAWEDGAPDRVKLAFSINRSTRLTMTLLLHDGRNVVCLRVFDLLQTQDVDETKVFRALNAMNARWNYARFYRDASDASVTAALDAAFCDSDIVDGCLRMARLLAHICEKAQPQLKKELRGRASRS